MMIEKFGRIDFDQIKAIEEKHHVTFPEEYIRLLQKTNGGNVDLDNVSAIQVTGTQEIVEFKTFFGIGLEENRNIEVLTEKNKNDLMENSVIIGEDLDGGYFVLTGQDQETYLLYWDKNVKLSLSSNMANGYIITDDFGTFLTEIGLFNDSISANTPIKIEKGDNTMERINYVPLGSIVLLDKGIKKILVTSRGLIVKNNDKEFFFDYAGVPYPEGLMSDELVYFNHSGISKVVFEGYNDDENEIVVDNINKFLEENPDIERGDVSTWVEE